ncbi:hypothetical protein BKA67DRAFT_521644 [Truncatella angustata]|uniref:Carrier domain-containing protein n=1 Tax=Truncatella angustata TaxID=152316 RepID=A0A9P8ZVX7_9PEZI|nr:uncharacterized protein BKA67DRAFT_521644 [Truncatella angustata]KAH6652455.1 hypothetical protein BKA67DRAFT_521644 [Truncatella angustata]
MQRERDSASAQYGHRLIPNVIDELARDDPLREAFQIPLSQDPQDGWEVITFWDYSNAVNLQAHKIVKLCGKAPVGTFPTLAYIGPQDARYVVFMVAAVKAGYQALFVSTRNSSEGQISLFNQTECQVLFCDGTYYSAIKPWASTRDINIIEVSPCDSWFPKTEAEHFPYDKTFEEAEWDPLCVLHTSGSTGLPKPIIVRQGMIAISDACHNLSDWQGCTHWICAWMEKSKRHFIPMPLFHAAGLYVFIISVIWWKTPIALGLGDRPLTAELATECLSALDVESAAFPPSVLEDMSQDSKGLKVLQKLQLIPIGGGSLARDTGDYLVEQGVVLCNLLNSTEFTPFPVYFQPRPELWQYFIINPDLFGCNWREAGENVYELVIERKDKHPGMQGFFYTFPDLDEVSTNDLFEPHPTLPNHWRYHGRADNVIVFSNGEKLNPVTIESIVQGHPQVKGALVVAGSRRLQPGLLIEPVVHPRNEDERCELIESLWPHVVRANEETVAHGQISKDFIAVTSPDKPFSRAGKGTVQRAATIEKYTNEIDQLYETAEQVSDLDGKPLDLSPTALTQSLVHILLPHVRLPSLDQDTNFFSAGMDSLQVMNASRRLRAGLVASGYPEMTQSLITRGIYNNPTATRLSQHIIRLVKQSEQGVLEQQEDMERHELEVMKYLYERYNHNLVRESQPRRPDAAIRNQVILLTGSTGTLGSHLLDCLLRNPTVGKVVCLNRAEDGGLEQQAKAMQHRGLTQHCHEKAEFHHVELAKDKLGLPENVYSRLLKEADRIIHCAWPVNFNLSTESFEPHIRGIRILCDFSAESVKRVMVLFISSISTVDRWDPSQGPVPEQRIEDWKLPGNGYGRSKMIGSLILEDAGAACDFPAVSIRVGQIAGPESDSGGSWNANEWLPSIIASSLYLSALPGDLGRANRVDWTPVERVASLITEIAGVDNEPSVNATEQLGGYFHCVNPSSTTWQYLVPAIQEFYGERIHETIGLEEWVTRLGASQTDDESASVANPGLKLIDTYRSLLDNSKAEPVILDMSRTNQTTRSMRGSLAITPELMKHWCTQWGF